MVTAARQERLRKLTREHIISAIRDDLPGGSAGEALMKEVWEECSGDSEFRIVEAEMRAIIKRVSQR